MAAGPRPLREGSSAKRRRPAERGREPGRGGSPHGALARALGVTRIARLTGLDRTGVEVASAVRPRGHVLQVTNGKGASAAEAAAGALLEASELAAAEHAAIDAWGSAAELAARHPPGAVVGPRALQPDGAPAWDDVRIAWRRGRDLSSGAGVLVPAHAVHVPPAGGPWLGPALVRWTSNGMGAAPDRAAALLHALLEAVERDRVARALPAGFTERQIRRRLVDPRSLARWAPRTAALAERIARSGLRVFLLDLSDPEPGLRLGVRERGRRRGRGRELRSAPSSTKPSTSGDLSLPAAAALLLDVEGGPVPLAAGYACRLGRDGALSAALLEAAQSRATEIHGAREDVAAGDRRDAEALRAFLERARPARTARALPELRARSVAGAIREVVRRLRRAGVRAVGVDLEGPPGVAVARVVAPGLLLSELLG